MSPRACTRGAGAPFGRAIAAVMLLFSALRSHATEPYTPRADWARHFAEFKAVGTIVVRDERLRPHRSYVHNLPRAGQRFSPASTYKIPHAALALELGLVKDEFQVFKWDGVSRGYEGWNRDQDLRSSMRHSVLWVYQGFARGIAEDKAKAFLEAVGYGNAEPSGGQDGYWIDGRLRISALEQLAFLQRLQRNELPLMVEHQRLVKDIMIVAAGDDWILRAKTGWEGRMGWWVGWVEWPSGPVFFALNIDTPERNRDLFKRRAIAEKVLRSIEALPAR